MTRIKEAAMQAAIATAGGGIAMFSRSIEPIRSPRNSRANPSPAPLPGFDETTKFTLKP